MALLTCCVCGRSSTRASWNNTNVYGSGKVACDFHSQNAIQSVVTANVPAVPSALNIPKSHNERESS